MDLVDKKTDAIFGRRNSSLLIDYLAHPETDRKLRSFYGVSSEKELLDRLGADFYYLSCRDISQNESLTGIYRGPKLFMDEKTRICPFGITWNRGAYSSKFAVDQAVKNPLTGASSEKDILDYPWPDPSWFDFEPFIEEVEQNSDRIIIGGFWSGVLGDSYRMYGFEHFLLDIAMNPQIIKTLINRMTDFYLELNSRLFEQLGDKVDIWFFGNDLGSQTGLLFSPEMLNNFFMNNFKKLCDLAHSYSINVMMHSCGAISEIIPHLIEAGVDILDPIQVTAEKMQPDILADKFGGKIVFHGGIDTQHVLPEGTREQVRKHCMDTVEIFTKAGPYIFAPSQILGPDIPLENIHVMYETAKEYKKSYQTKD